MAIPARLAAFEHAIERALPPASTPPRSLHAAMRYSVLGPGKRVRPLFVLAACEAAGGRWRDALPAAVAIELVHCFSLVHDDLPSMDDDEYRRGRLTTHMKFDEATALLAGDALLALAFEELSRWRATPGRVAAAVRVLARASGSRELVGGQVLDLEAEGRRQGERDVRAIHERKTGALLAAALELGALAAGATPARRRSFARAGRSLGFAFQIQDDVLNRRSTLATLGKRAGTDAARGKATYPGAVGERRADAVRVRLFEDARRAVTRLGRRGAVLAELIERVAARGPLIGRKLGGRHPSALHCARALQVTGRCPN